MPLTTTLQPKRHGHVLPARAGQGGFTLGEIIVAAAIAGLLLTAVARQIVECAVLNLRISRALEYSRNARMVIDTLSADIRGAQLMRLYPEFSDRSAEARDGGTGNYLVLQNFDDAGTITRTVGYYLVSLGGAAGWAVYRHDSNQGDSAADGLPAAGSSGTHRMVRQVLRLPDTNRIFRCFRDRGVSIEGEFAPPGAVGSGRAEFIRCTVLSRS